MPGKVPLPRGGVIIPAVEAAEPAAARFGSESALEFGVPRPPVAIGPAGGSMSKEDRKDVVSRSLMRLVIVRKVSMRSFCS